MKAFSGKPGTNFCHHQSKDSGSNFSATAHPEVTDMSSSKKHIALSIGYDQDTEIWQNIRAWAAKLCARNACHILPHFH